VRVLTTRLRRVYASHSNGFPTEFSIIASKNQRAYRVKYFQM
jgi:hypothetical protein